MGMIVTTGFRQGFDNQAFECLRCGHTEKPTAGESRIVPPAMARVPGGRYARPRPDLYRTAIA
jgi:hypothetical protein